MVSSLEILTEGCTTQLAERTIKATQEVTGKIKAVQEEATSTMRSMQQASGEVTKANDFIRSVGESLQ